MNETAPGHLWVSYVAGSGAVEAAFARWSVDAMAVAVVVKGHTSPSPTVSRGGRGAIDVTVDGQRFRARTEIRGLAHRVFQAVGVGPPPLLTRVESAPVSLA